MTRQISAKPLDDRYVEVPGTNPQLYRNGFCDWADQHWRPVLDRVKASDPNIVATVCDDRNGFLPTHLSDRSRKPTGNYEHDLQYCRNGRMIFNAIDKRIKGSDAPFSMAVYRYEGDGKQYRVVRLAMPSAELDIDRPEDLLALEVATQVKRQQLGDS